MCTVLLIRVYVTYVCLVYVIMYVSIAFGVTDEEWLHREHTAVVFVLVIDYIIYILLTISVDYISKPIIAIGSYCVFLQGSQGSRGEAGMQGLPGMQGPIGPRGLSGPPGFCEHEFDVDGSGEGSGEMEDNLISGWKDSIPSTRTSARLSGTKGVKGQKVRSQTQISSAIFYCYYL